MRTWPVRAAALLLVLLSCTAALLPVSYAWEKEQQALNSVLDEGADFEPVDVELPGITKEVVGEDAPAEQFTFVLQGQNDAPMPKAAAGSQFTVSRLGPGAVIFGGVTFEKPGTYVYTVYEVGNDDIDWTYDSAHYTVTITVTVKDEDKKESENGKNQEEKLKLTAETTIKKNGKAASKILFTNTYEKIDLTEKVTISGQKTWEHGRNPEKNRPDHIVVMVYADGELVDQQKVTAETDWKYSFTLPKYTESGKKIKYTVDEEKVTGYSKKISGYDITNTYVPTKPPKTGDEFPLTLWISLMAVGLCGFVLMLLLLRKQSNYQGRHLKKKGKRLKKNRRDS